MLNPAISSMSFKLFHRAEVVQFIASQSVMMVSSNSLKHENNGMLAFVADMHLIQILINPTNGIII